jgi:hypothetical protein
MMLVNYRPEFIHNWSNKTYYTQLRLDPLSAASGEEMLQALLDDGHELVPLKRLIIEKTEGNPFFMEEIVQALFEQGALLRNGAIKLPNLWPPFRSLQPCRPCWPRASTGCRPIKKTCCRRLQ